MEEMVKILVTMNDRRYTPKAAGMQMELSEAD